MGKIWENAFHSAVSCFFPAWCQMASPWSASIDRWHASWNRPQALCQRPPCAQALAAALAETMSPRIAWCRVLDCNCRKIHWQTKSSTGMKGAPLRWLFPVSIFHVCYFHLSILWDLLLVDLVGSRFPRCHCCWYTTTSKCGEFVEESQCWHKYLAVCQNLVPLVNIKIAGKWMFIPLKMVLIGIDP